MYVETLQHVSLRNWYNFFFVVVVVVGTCYTCFRKLSPCWLQLLGNLQTNHQSVMDLKQNYSSFHSIACRINEWNRYEGSLVAVVTSAVRR